MKKGRPKLSKFKRTQPKTVSLSGETRLQIDALIGLLGVKDPRGGASKVITLAVAELFRRAMAL